MKALSFTIQEKIPNKRGRSGTITTPHGEIQTPAFAVVGTKGTIKTLSPEEVKDLGAQVVLANTYHLYLEPGHERVQKAGGLHNFMNWQGPIITDSGGFQVFSQGVAYGQGLSKVVKDVDAAQEFYREPEQSPALAKITDDGVSFKSFRDGSEHFFTPERSMEIQHALGADIMFAFDECTSPLATHEYQREALVRTHAWAKRSLDAHKANKEASDKQALFGVVQGGRFADLRAESAQVLAQMDFDGFGIGGSFTKDDIEAIVAQVNSILPENKPRHLLGIGEPTDLFAGVEAGIDLFDCVAPTRIARNGQLYTKTGKINILNTRFTDDYTPIENDCVCYTCKHYTRAYLSHLFRSHELFGLRLASIHNVHFIVNLMESIRISIQEKRFSSFKETFLNTYTQKT
jgi:queuine tRNA-ribosyltransferase